MRILKIFTNTLLAGAYGGALYLLLIFYLNPDLTLGRAGRGDFLTALPAIGSFYAVSSTLVWIGFLLAGRLFWRGRLAPHWISFRYTVWMLVVNLSVLVVLFGVNRWVYRWYLPPELSRLLLISTAILVGLLVAIVGVAVAGHRRARRPHRYGAALAPLIALLLMGWLRASYVPAVPALYEIDLPAGLEGPVTFVAGIDAASMDMVLPIAAKGNLPNLSRLMREGTTGRFRGFRPAYPAALWASLSTGKLAYRHGLFGDREFRIAGSAVEIAVVPLGLPAFLLEWSGCLRELPPGARRLETRDLESILADFAPGLRFVDWRGSPREAPVFLEQDWRRDDRTGLWIPSAGWESTGFNGLRETLVTIAVPVDRLDGDIQVRLAETLRDSIQEDLLTFQEMRNRLGEEPPPAVFAVRFQGLGRVARVFLRYHMPGAFGNVAAEVTQRYGGVIEAYYRFLDDICGLMYDSLPEGGRMFVVSPVGIEPLGFEGRTRSLLVERGLTSGGQGRAPEGVFLSHGPGILADAQIEDVSVLDFAPTFLYSLGLPVGRDMDGEVRDEIFEPDFTAAHPVFLIPSYEGARIQNP
jgi:hypothetical protein